MRFILFDMFVLFESLTALIIRLHYKWTRDRHLILIVTLSDMFSYAHGTFGLLVFWQKP